MSAGRRVLAPVAVARQRFRSGQGSLLVFVALVTVTMGLAAALPRLAGAALDDAARRSVAAAPAVVRDLEFTSTDSLAPGTTHPLEAVEAAGTALQADLPPSVGDLIVDRNDVIDTVEFIVADAPVSITQVKFRIQTGLEDRIAFVEGRPPAQTSETQTLSGRVDDLGQPYVADVYEVALSTPTLERVRLAVGDTLLLSPDEDDLIVQQYGTFGVRGFVVARIVGRFDVVDPEDPFWFDDPGLREPFREPISIELSIFHVGALVHPGMYPRMVGVDSLTRPTSLSFPLRYTWRYRMDPQRLQAGTLPTLAADVTRLQARYPFTGANTLGDPPSLRWGLRDLLERHTTQQRTSQVTLTLAALGPIGTGVGALALVALVVIRRREASIRLLRSRGASAVQLLAAQALETTVLVVPAAIMATVVAVALTPGPDVPGAALRAAVVGVVAVALVLAVTWPLTRGRIDAGDVAAGRATGTRSRTWLRRLVFDGTVIALAAIAVVTLQQRGLGDGSGPLTVDPLLAAVPVLVALAAGLVLLRVYPLPLRLIAAIAARGRGLIPTFPLWGAARQSRIAAVPLLVILVATSIGAFSSVVLESVRQGQLAASWRAVGADWRIDADTGIAVPSALDVGTVPGVGPIAGLTETEGVLRNDIVRRQQTAVVGLDPATFAAATASSAYPLPIAADLARPDWEAGTAGTDADPVPVIASTALAARARLGVGSVGFVRVAGIETAVRVVATTDVLPGDPGLSTFLVAPIGAMQVVFPGVRLDPTSYLVQGGAAVGESLATAIAPYGDLLHLRSRDAVYQDLHDTPLIAIVEAGMTLALVIAVAYAGLALLAGLTIALAVRRRDLHVLRTLGLSRGGISSTIVIEQVPLILVALIGGGLVGVGLALVVGPSVGLAAFTDGLSTVPIVVDPLATVAVGVLPMAAGVGAALLSGFLLRRSDLARAVRFTEG